MGRYGRLCVWLLLSLARESKPKIRSRMKIAYHDWTGSSVRETERESETGDTCRNSRDLRSERRELVTQRDQRRVAAARIAASVLDRDLQPRG